MLFKGDIGGGMGESSECMFNNSQFSKMDDRLGAGSALFILPNVFHNNA